MKFLERLALVIYSYIVILLSVVLCLLVFNWIDIESLNRIVETLVTGDISSKVVLGLSVVFILLSIKCIFFDERSKEKLKEAQGILLKNENGELMISKETIDNMVKNAVASFEDIKECKTRIDVNMENQIMITLVLAVNGNTVIKDLASNIQDKVKDEVKKVSDLEVKTVNIKITELQEDKRFTE